MQITFSPNYKTYTNFGSVEKNDRNRKKPLEYNYSVSYNAANAVKNYVLPDKFSNINWDNVITKKSNREDYLTIIKTKKHPQIENANLFYEYNSIENNLLRKRLRVENHHKTAAHISKHFEEWAANGCKIKDSKSYYNHKTGELTESFTKNYFNDGILSALTSVVNKNGIKQIHSKLYCADGKTLIKEAVTLATSCGTRTTKTYYNNGKIKETIISYTPAGFTEANSIDYIKRNKNGNVVLHTHVDKDEFMGNRYTNKLFFEGTRQVSSEKIFCINPDTKKPTDLEIIKYNKKGERAFSITGYFDDKTGKPVKYISVKYLDDGSEKIKTLDISSGNCLTSHKKQLENGIICTVTNSNNKQLINVIYPDGTEDNHILPLETPDDFDEEDMKLIETAKREIENINIKSDNFNDFQTLC